MYNFLRLVYRCIGAFCSCTFYSYWQLTLVNPLKCGMFDQTLTNSQDNLKQQLQARRPQCTSLTCQPVSSHWTCCDGHRQFSCWATAASQRAVALWKWYQVLCAPWRICLLWAKAEPPWAHCVLRQETTQAWHGSFPPCSRNEVGQPRVFKGLSLCPVCAFLIQVIK